ncbi:hypothetical protein D9M68_924460 [compost metagenome]
MHLHQVDALALQQRHGLLHLLHAGLATLGPDLGGDEGAVLGLEFVQQATDGLLRLAVHG